MRQPSGGDDLYAGFDHRGEAGYRRVRAGTTRKRRATRWDYDAVSPMMTADLTIGGKKQHVLDAAVEERLHVCARREDAAS